jgi:hypothetical protein
MLFILSVTVYTLSIHAQYPALVFSSSLVHPECYCLLLLVFMPSYSLLELSVRPVCSEGYCFVLLLAFLHSNLLLDLSVHAVHPVSASCLHFLPVICCCSSLYTLFILSVSVFCLHSCPVTCCLTLYIRTEKHCPGNWMPLNGSMGKSPAMPCAF